MGSTIEYIAITLGITYREAEAKCKIFAANIGKDISQVDVAIFHFVEEFKYFPQSYEELKFKSLNEKS